MIDVRDLTLRYPNGKGVFNLDFSIAKGEVTGYLGPNGAGKTTTIRALLGFMSPDSGTCTIDGLDCFAQAPAIQRSLGYIPGETAFISGMCGDEFLAFMQEMRGVHDRTVQKQLLERFELDPRGKIRRFSKGMKQKLAIVTAFMHDPAVLILDEPTSGLDPLMQNRFVDLIRQEKVRGKTILMSSHSFDEVDKTCDRVAIIRDGRIVQQSDVQTLRKSQRRAFILIPVDIAAAVTVLDNAGFTDRNRLGETITARVAGDQVDRFIKAAARIELKDFDVVTQSLEDVFMQFYGNTEVTA